MQRRVEETKQKRSVAYRSRVMLANESLHPDRRPLADLLESKVHGWAAAGERER